MSFMDRVKATAQEVASEARKGASQARQRMEKAQVRRSADELAKQLGYLIVQERTQGVPVGDQGDRLVSEIVRLQAQLQTEVVKEPDGTERIRSTSEPVRVVEPPPPPAPAQPPAGTPEPGPSKMPPDEGPPAATEPAPGDVLD